MSRRRDACIYCGAPSDSRDHAPPRLFLESPRPSNLRTVPACRRCNQGASADEEYVGALLAHTGTAQVLQDKVATGGVVDRALLRSRKLASRIEGASRVLDNGLPAIAPEPQPIHRVVRKIAHGLFVGRYGRNPGPKSFRSLGIYPYSIEDQRPALVFAATYSERFRPKRWQVIQKNVFAYIFVRHPRRAESLLCVMDFHGGAWGIAECPTPTSGRPVAVAGQPCLL